MNPKLKKIREDIDFQDELIMEALDKRFQLVKSLAAYKDLLTDLPRESEILAKAPSPAVSSVYEAIFAESKKLLRQRKRWPDDSPEGNGL